MMMKAIVLAGGLAAACVGLAGCQVKKTQEGEMPKVTGGQLPEYQVKTPDVNVGHKTEKVEVPTVSVTPASKKP